MSFASVVAPCCLHFLFYYRQSSLNDSSGSFVLWWVLPSRLRIIYSFHVPPRLPEGGGIEISHVHRRWVFWVAHDSVTKFGASHCRDLVNFRGPRKIIFTDERKHQLCRSFKTNVVPVVRMKISHCCLLVMTLMMTKDPSFVWALQCLRTHAEDSQRNEGKH